MSNLSENKILQRLNLRVNNLKTKYAITNEDLQAIQGLLDLYNKEKEEKERYKRIAKMNLKDGEEFKDNMCEHRCPLKTELEEEKEKTNNLARAIKYMGTNPDITEKEIIEMFEKNPVTEQQIEKMNKEYISKDKIKEKIKELEQDVKDFEEYWSKDPRKFKKEKSIDYYKLEALKELLEE